MKILMVCLGNICRSPLAEGILQSMAEKRGLNWEVESAGTNNYHIGSPPHKFSQKVAISRGIDICNQRARRLKPSDYQEFDYIIAMANDVVSDIKEIAGKSFQKEKTYLLMNFLHEGKNQDVPDPYYGEEDGYHEVYDMIEAACEKLIEKITNSEK